MEEETVKEAAGAERDQERDKDVATSALEAIPLDSIVDSAERWIRENRTLALAGSFAFGVFVGVMMGE